MSIRRIEVQKIKTGNYILVDGEPCIVKTTEKSKSGKHGHAKVRIVAVGMFDNNKKSLTYPSGTMIDYPEILKGNAQINFIEDTVINIMDLTTYQSFDVIWPTDPELIAKLKELRADPAKMSSTQVEHWELADRRLINRIFNV